MRNRFYIIAILSAAVLIAQPSFSAHTITTGADNFNSVYAIDMDRDGDMDILSSEYGGAGGSGGEINWFENNGSQTFTMHNIMNLGVKTNKVNS